MKLGFLLYDGITALDLFGPLDIFGRVVSWEVELCACSQRKYDIGNGLFLTPKTILNQHVKYDVIVVPGGTGQIGFCEDQSNLNLLKAACHNTRYLLGVCTGALILGFCGLLKDKKATTNRLCLSLVEKLGAILVNQRVVEDHNIITCGGVTAGIDLALYFVRKIEGDEVAKKIQMNIEYDPQPLYNFHQLENDRKLIREIYQDKKNIIDERNKQTDRFLDCN